MIKFNKIENDNNNDYFRICTSNMPLTESKIQQPKEIHL